MRKIRQYLTRGKCNLNDFTEGKLSQSVCPKTLKERGVNVNLKNKKLKN